MKVIATIARSNGNETVGDMWHETAIFDSSKSIESVFKWVNAAISGERAAFPGLYLRRSEVVLTIAQEPTL